MHHIVVLDSSVKSYAMLLLLLIWCVGVVFCDGSLGRCAGCHCCCIVIVRA